MPLSKLPASLDGILQEMVAISLQAGERAMADYRRGSTTTAQIEMKAGGSPVTAADLAVDAMIGAHLGVVWPSLHYHSEERPESWLPAQGDSAFVCDPIDGTRSYLSGGDEWCISLALVVGGRAVAAVIHAPARGETFSASEGGGAFLNGVRLAPETRMLTRPVGSGPRTIFDQLSPLFTEGVAQGPRLAALAYRLIAPLTGQIDLAAARPGAHDWDIAAADCLLREAGGQIAYLNGASPWFALDGSGHSAMVAGLSPLLQQMNRAALPLLSGQMP